MGVIMEKLENVRSDVAEIKTILSCHVNDQAKFESDSLTYRAAAKEVIANMQKDLTNHELRLKQLEDIVKELSATNKFLRWVGGIAGASIVALVIAILTGQAAIVFP
jgi:ribosomal protein L29